MKKVAIISLSVLFLAACSSSNYDEEVATESYQEAYQTDEVEQPITAPESAPVEEDVASTNEEKKVVKLSPETSANEQQESEDSVRVFYNDDNSALEQPSETAYLVQVGAFKNPKYLTSLDTSLPTNQPKWQHAKTVNDSQWYGLLFGNFASDKEARDAILRLPASVQAMKPFVKSVKSIKSSAYPELKKLP